MVRISERLSRAVSDNWGRGISAFHLRNLWWFWWDGAFATGSDSITVTFLALYAASLGVTSGQIGIMSSLGSLSAAMVLLPGAFLVERVGRRQRIAFLIGLSARTFLLCMACAPIAAQGFPAIFLLIPFSVLRDATGFFGNPAWTSLTADIVPNQVRGRYFASRNFANTVMGMIAIYLAGLLITAGNGSSSGYQGAMLLAVMLGYASSFCFGRIKDPHPEPPPEREPSHPRQILSGLFRQPVFLGFCLISALFNFSLNIAGPFFNLHLVQNLHATANNVSLLTITTSLSTLFALRMFGNLTDRFGSFRIAAVTGMLIPILPFAWIFATEPWHIFPINIASGILWAGYNLAIFNLLLAYTPDASRARFSAIYQILITLALAGGAAFGGWVSTVSSYQVNFLLSCIGRTIAGILFLLVLARKQSHSVAPSKPAA